MFIVESMQHSGVSIEYIKMMLSASAVTHYILLRILILVLVPLRRYNLLVTKTRFLKEAVVLYLKFPHF